MQSMPLIKIKLLTKQVIKKILLVLWAKNCFPVRIGLWETMET